MTIDIERTITNYNTPLLDEELRAVVGEYIGFTGIGTTAILHFADSAAQADIDAADAVIAAHDHTLLSTIEVYEEKVVVARANAKAIPAWATWTEDEVNTWITGKFDQPTIGAITNLAEAQVVLGDMATAMRAMARLIIALRDAQWPDLGDN